jgi:hypothetical protein
VGKRQGKCLTTAISLLLALLFSAPIASADPLGSDLGAAPDGDVCSTPGAEIVCTESQLWLAEEHRAGEALFTRYRGVITQWQVASGMASPPTESVRLRLRLLRGREPRTDAVTAFQRLPLADPGIHRFPARLPISWNDRLALDVAVRGDGSGTASAPIAHSEAVGEVGEWVPPLASTPRLPSYRFADTELLLKARMEFDLDEDGFGDSTQDRCRYDPRRQQTRCLEDNRPPRVEVRYAKRQSFRDGAVRVKVRSNQFGDVWVVGSLETPSIQTQWIGIGSEAWVKRGEWANLTLYLEPEARAAARQEIEAGGHPYASVEASAYDTSGNEAERRRVVVRVPGR